MSKKKQFPIKKTMKGGVLALTQPLKVLKDNKKMFKLNACKKHKK